MAGGPTYPHNKVVQFSFRRFSAAARSKIRTLDLGCGTGANARFLAENGFRLTATDVSAVAVEATRSRLRASDLDAIVRQEPAWLVGDDNFTFDYVACVGVLEALSLPEAVATMKEVHRVLKPTGEAFFLFAAEGDFRVGRGTDLGLRGYSRREVEQLASTFGCCEIDVYSSTYGGGATTQMDWMLHVGGDDLDGFS